MDHSLLHSASQLKSENLVISRETQRIISLLFARSMVTVAMEDNESCGSGVHHRTSSSSSIPGQSRHHRQKLEVYNEILRRLNDSGNEEAMQPGFSDQLWAHFNRLPSRSFPRILSSHLYN
jgi:hypothetical protein